MNEGNSTLAVRHTDGLTTLGLRVGQLDESLDSLSSFDTEDLLLIKDTADSSDMSDTLPGPDINRASTTWWSDSFTNFEYSNEFFDGVADILGNSEMMSNLDGGLDFDFATALPGLTLYVRPGICYSTQTEISGPHLYCRMT